MLDNEPIVGAAGLGGDTTAQQEPKAPARRRRAASRPAGPPPEEPEHAGRLLTGVSPEGAAGAGGAAATRETAPTSTADGTTGTGTGAGGAGTAAADGTGGADGTPVAPVAEEAAEAPAPAKRATRRRATAKDGDAPAPARRTRARKSAKADAEPEADAPPAPPEQVALSVETVQAEGVAQAAQAGGAAQVEEVSGEETAPAAPVRRRRSRKAAAVPETPAATAAATERSSTEHTADTAETAGTSAVADTGGTVVDEDAEDIAEVLPEEEPLDDEPAGEDVVEEPRSGSWRGKTSLFADPFGLTALTDQVASPSVAFQAPAAVFQPVFQAPEPRAAVPPVAPPPPPRRAEERPEERAEDEEPADEPDIADESAEDDDQDEAGSRRRRRRRGGRGRGRLREQDEADGEETGDEPVAAEDAVSAEDESQGEAADADDDEAGGSRRRRRRRRRGTEEAETHTDDPPNTVVRIRAPRAGRATSVDEVQGFRGSTRLEAKKQRRREGREQGRRRPPVITESEFLARRESVERVMVVRRQAGRTQIAVMEDGVLVEHYVDRESSQSYVGNVYLGKVQNVLPSMEAAFIDGGKGRNAVLYAGEVNFDTAGLEGQPKRIEAALKSGQSVLVQVTKDPMGHKGARLTSQISLPGRYLVYVPDGSMTGISRKLPDKERSRLKAILKKVMPENAGVIVRTAAEGASEEELSRDVSRLSAQWENIQRKAKSGSPPELLYSEPDLTIRVVRDVFNEDFSSLVVSGDEAWGTVDEYVRYVAPHLVDRLTKWEEGDVFAAYRIDEQIAKAMERKVWLPSGGSLVIDRTEAMTVVDVNTGKFTGQGGNLEETVTKNNLEAAEEIVRQLRLRDIGGIIVIDFIDMVLESNRDLVLRRMLECLARDRTKHQVAEVTSLGLVQMTRKRVGQGLLEAFSTPCDCCNGRGLIVSSEPVESKPEPRGTQGKMAVEKAVAEKLEKAAERVKDGVAAVAAVGEAVRDSVTDALAGEDSQPVRTRRRSRKATRPAGPAE
ncbi:Rne/Rng family ribonuclease [Sphaerisporangium sp. B11E5]|uniref:Rne/Rng family ribonuclease n=1 Tax=Sphaerisporangium sp. B11E5 TaxID=3153563 RepID=UPI00325CB262